MNLKEATQLLKSSGYICENANNLYYVYCISVVNDNNSDYQKDTDYTNLTYDDLLNHGLTKEEIEEALEGMPIIKDTPFEDDGYCDGAEEYSWEIMPMSELGK